MTFDCLWINATNYSTKINKTRTSQILMTAMVFRVHLQETRTMELYYQENTSLHFEDQLAAIFIAQWDVYRKKKNSGLVRSREITCQTVPYYTMDKTTQKSAVSTKDTSCMATQSSMYDEYRTLKKSVTDMIESSRMTQKLSKFSSRQGHSTSLLKDLTRRKRQIHPKKQYYLGDPKKFSTEDPLAPDGGSGHHEVAGVEVNSLLKGLACVERQLCSIENLKNLRIYTSHPTRQEDKNSETVDNESKKTEELWTFRSDVTEGLRVNCIVFCNDSPWLILAAYGNLSFSDDSGGVFCGWSAKRIDQPELWISLPLPVTVVSSCPVAPQLCCIALLDGTIRVYQLDTPTPTLIMDTSCSVDKHSAPVWAVDWRESYATVASLGSYSGKGASVAGAEDVADGGGGGGPSVDDTTCPANRSRVTTEIPLPLNGSSERSGYGLVSVSEDGTVKEWLFTFSGLYRCTTLMKVCVPPWVSLEIAGGLPSLLPNEEGTQDKSPHVHVGSGNSRPVVLLPEIIPATRLAFRPGDNTTYLLGTVSGDILMCKTFERRGTRTLFRGHSSMITRLAWRPMPPDDVCSIFLSSAMDDTIRIWHVDKMEPLCVLKNVQASESTGGYSDACWCPWYNNILVGVHGEGFHLWDISVLSHAPILTYEAHGASSISFSPQAKNVILGCRDGTIQVVHFEGITPTTSNVFQKLSAALSKIAMFNPKKD
ncbi:dynein axonemal intermediate chain 4-like [Macrobrachium rosenbergii]|uniref:dynein axonemal intermediate chain 4-like n=1 Tax=Macrobrachium rosenbergii TaxID=79674 RepID=UPI0034D6EB4C